MSTTKNPKAKHAAKAKAPRPTTPKRRKPATEQPQPAEIAADVMPATAPKAPTRERRLTLLDAAVRALGESAEPMGAKEMVARIMGAGWWTTQGRTPEATLYSAIIREIGSRDGKTRFVKTGRGRFHLTELGKAG